MAFRVKELGGRSGTASDGQEGRTLLFDVWDPDNRWPSSASVYAAAVSAIPGTFDGLGLDNVSWEEEDEFGHTVFSANYSTGEQPESVLRIGFDTTGGSVRVRTSRDTTSYVRAGRTAPDYKGAIEVSGDEPQGVDVTIPALKLIFKYKWPKGTFGLAQAKAVASITGSTNDASWQTFDEGELLFLGASGEIDAALPTDVTYSFAASANATLSIGGIITGIAKKGHQHLWVKFEDVVDATAKKTVQQPLAAYVETLYKTSAFSALGIG